MLSNQPQQANILPVISESTLIEIENYLNAIRQKGLEQSLNDKTIGRRLYEVLKDSDTEKMATVELIDALLKTTKPLCFAENTGHVNGDGTDWTNYEISLLGRIARVVKDVSVYSRSTYKVTEKDLFLEGTKVKATLLFTNGALLSGCGSDQDRVLENGKFNQEKYYQFLEENLLPSLFFANNDAGDKGAVVTLPILGGKMFAGAYENDIKNYFKTAIQKLLLDNQEKLKNIKGVVITGLPYSSTDIKTINVVSKDINIINLVTTEYPLGLYPQSFGKFINYKTYACIAADHVSFPGNDGYKLSNSTHEGGSCTVTDVYSHITKAKGSIKKTISGQIYSPEKKGLENEYSYIYSPEKGNWENVCANEKITLNFDAIEVYNKNGYRRKQAFIKRENKKIYQPNYLDPLQPADYLSNIKPKITIQPIQNPTPVFSSQKQEKKQKKLKQELNNSLQYEKDSMFKYISESSDKSVKGVSELIMINPKIINAQEDVNGETPLSFALLHLDNLHKSKDTQYIREIIKTLINHYKYDIPNFDGDTALAKAAMLASTSSLDFLEIIVALIDKGANLNSKNKNDQTPLYYLSKLPQDRAALLLNFSLMQLHQEVYKDKLRNVILIDSYKKLINTLINTNNLILTIEVKNDTAKSWLIASDNVKVRDLLNNPDIDKLIEEQNEKLLPNTSSTVAIIHTLVNNTNLEKIPDEKIIKIEPNIEKVELTTEQVLTNLLQTITLLNSTLDKLTNTLNSVDSSLAKLSLLSTSKKPVGEKVAEPEIKSVLK